MMGLPSSTESAVTARLQAPRSARSTCFKSMAETCGVSRLKRASGPSPNSCAGLIQAWRSIHITRPTVRSCSGKPAGSVALRPHRTLDQGQEPEGASGKARSARGLAIAAGDVRCRLPSRRTRRRTIVSSITPQFRPFAESLRLLLCRTPIPQYRRAGAGWNIRGLSSTLLNEIPASGGQKFRDSAEGLSLLAAREFGDL
jgi:hypothetical protein